MSENPSNLHDPATYASTPEEIRQALRENSVQRGLFFLKNLSALQVDDIMQEVEMLGERYDMEAWREQADAAGIAADALDTLDAHDPPVPYPHYFCLPADLIRQPQLVLYYRNVAMISNKVMNNIGLDTTKHELGEPLPEEKARSIAQHLNQITSALVLNAELHGRRRHLEMMYANIGASLDGGWRNEVGRLAYVNVLSPLAHHLHRFQKLDSIEYRLKGRIVLDDDEKQSRAVQTATVRDLSDEALRSLLAQLEEERIVYRQLNLTNGNRVLFNRQIIWQQPTAGPAYRIGPDLITQDANENYPWAAELKGGADPAGSDEHWKTATRAFDRMIDAAEKTGRPTPQLTFLATILVDRVAQEAALWLAQGKLTSVHNLTKIANDPAKREAFLNEMVTFFAAQPTETKDQP